MEDLDKRIAEANDEFISEEEEIVTPPPIDVLQTQRDIARDYAQKSFPRGSRTQVLATVQDVINGVGTDSLGQAYERAKADAEAVDKMGDHRRAQIIKNQYMEEHFLPAVEVVVNFTSPDELLNCREGLKALDKYALGLGSMEGYTAAYVSNAYANALGQVSQASSPEVTDSVMRLNGFLESDQMLLARSLAQKMLKKINEGKVIASEEDYNLFLNVANNWPK